MLDEGLYMLSEGVFRADRLKCELYYVVHSEHLKWELDLSDSARAVETSKERYERFPLPLAMQGTDICIARTIIISIDETTTE